MAQPDEAGSLDAEAARGWVLALAEAVEETCDQLTSLDAAIGDGDHGTNMRRGMRAVVEALDGFDAPTPGAVLKKAGMTLISSVGGASGPLYGSAFRAMGKALDAPEADAGQLAAAFSAGLEAVQRLGSAQVGDKTMVDAWAPAAEAFATEAVQGPRAASEAAALAAEAGARGTVPLQAHKGRASYLGERSIGHQDPGATSTALLFRALAEVLAKGPE
jgi:dihydroxyacetone kinase-like protein